MASKKSEKDSVQAVATENETKAPKKRARRTKAETQAIEQTAGADPVDRIGAPKNPPNPLAAARRRRRPNLKPKRP